MPQSESLPTSLRVLFMKTSNPIFYLYFQLTAFQAALFSSNYDIASFPNRRYIGAGAAHHAGLCLFLLFHVHYFMFGEQGFKVGPVFETEWYEERHFSLSGKE